jgi:SAM-dependent methyltransferase
LKRDKDLKELLGQIDIYWLDQILRGRVEEGMRVLDAGCGRGRNLVYLLRAGYEVFGVDRDPDAVDAVRRLACELSPELPQSNFRCETLQEMSFEAESMDVVVSSAVLHFAESDVEFDSMLRASFRPLRPGGLFFARLASTIGMEHQMRRIQGRRFALPDASERYLVDEALLLEWTEALGGRLADPLKTTLVQDQRAMTTWVVRKNKKTPPLR